MGRKKPHPGQVIKSRGELTAHGLTIKEWQRTPKQLLSEYCQSQNRPRPLYKNAPSREDGKFRTRVVLPDPKGVREKDIVLVTAESYETKNESEHATALLVLSKVDGDRQHEKRLPEPYSTAWLSMREGGSKPPQQSSASKKSSAAPEFTCEWCSKKFKKEHGLNIHIKREHAAEVTAAQEAGAIEGGQSGVQKVEPVDSEEGSLFNFDRDEPKATQSQNSTAFTISSQGKFSSQQERRLADKARDEALRASRRKKEQFENSNPYANVFMSEEQRRLVENVIRLYGSMSAGEGSGTQESAVGAAMRDAEHFAPLVGLGFREQDVAAAIESCGDDASYEELLDWMCIYAPEEYLPKGFDPRGKQFEVFVTKNKTTMQLGVELLVEAVGTDLEPHLKEETHRLDAIFHLYSKFMETHVGHAWPEPLDDQDPEIKETCTQLREDELILLESSFVDGEIELERGLVAQTASHVFDRHRLRLGKIEPVPGDSVLEIITLSGAQGVHEYPHQSAIVLFWNPELNRHINAEMMRLLAQHALSSKTNPHVYELWDVARNLLPQVFAQKPRFPFPVKEMQAIANAVSAAQILTSESAVVQKRSGNHQRRPKRKRDNSQALLEEYERKLKQDTNYKNMLQHRDKLPASSQRDEVLKAIEENQVVLISGETGCGKTTQIPQFILDHFIKQGEGGKIDVLCTQPRRLAAIGVALRVVEERCDPKIGGTVGYQIRLENETSEQTRLAFVTTGILLRRLQTDPLLEGVTHVIVDEVHERNVDTDFLLSILKALLMKRKDLKLVLMSATMEASLFCNYFGTKAVIKIPGFVHPVQDHFLEDILKHVQYSAHEQAVQKKGWDDALAQLERDTDYTLVAEVVAHIHQKNPSCDGSILIFMSGAAEISRTINAIQKRCPSGIFALPLHGGLSGKDQSKVFARAPKGLRKVVVSTNVAETSITIDDIVYVVDSGKHKETQYDPVNRMSMLVETWVSRNSARQRRGRAGRVRPGQCFKLYSRKRHDVKMEQAQLPEIHRVPLEQLVLQILSTDLGQPQAFMDTLMEPPPSISVSEAVRLLADVGAARLENINVVCLTPLGKHLAKLPMDVRIAKMLIYGSLLLCADQVLTIAAALTVRNPFLSPPDKRDEANQAKKDLLGGESVHLTQSDHLCLLYAFEKWHACKGEKERRAFADKFFLHHQSLCELRDLRKDFRKTLEGIGFDASSSASRQGSSSVLSKESVALVKAALCAGLYPNVINVRKPLQKFSEALGGAVAVAPEAQQLRMMIKRQDVQPDAAGATSSSSSSSSSQSASFIAHIEEQEKDAKAHQSNYKGNNKSLERVYLHPSSVNFHQREYHVPWMVYREKVKTSKVFIRDCTVVPPYSLLMFGGDISVQHEKGTVSVDGWVTFRAQARIGVLVRELRKILDQLLEKKINDPRLDIAHTDVLHCIKNLIISSGFSL